MKLPAILSKPVVLSIGLLSLVSLSTSHAALKKWQDAQGKIITGEYVRSEGGKVVLKKANKKVVAIHLSPDSKRNLAVLAERIPPGGIYHSVRNRYFDFYIQKPKGAFFIQPKDVSGAPVGKALSVYLHTGASKNEVWHNRNVIGLESAPEIDGNKILVKYKIDEGVLGEVACEVKDREVIFSYSITEPGGIDGEGHYKLMVDMKAIVEWNADLDMFAGEQYPEGIETDKMEALFKTMQVTTKPQRGKQKKYDYNEPVERLGENLKYVELSGVYPPRKLKILGPSGSNGELVSWIYEQNPPYKGFSVRLQKKDFSTPVNKSGEKMTLSFQ